MTNSTSPLEGVRILDFSYLLPGPYGTMMLGDLGAEIIKIENLNNPDMIRLNAPFSDGVSAAYAHINRGKKSLALDLKKQESKEIIKKLLSRYDIVVEQFRPGVMERLGLGYDELKKIQKKLIYCSLSGYGQTGSYSARAGHDINYRAISGIESYSGRAGERPSPQGIQIADVCGGSKNLAIAILAAIIKRHNTGEGDYIDISITDSTFALSPFQTAAYLAGGEDPQPEKDLLNGGWIYDFYRTADDRFISAGVLEPKFVKSFLQVLDLPCPSDRAQETEIIKLKSKIAGKIFQKPLEYWREKFKSADACVEPVLRLSEAINNAPISQRGMVVDVKSQSGASLKQPGNPIKFRSGDFVARNAGVSLGHHNEEVLKSIGYTSKEIKFLKDRGVIGP